MGQAAVEPEAVRQAVAAVRKPLIRQVLLLVPLAADLLLRVALGHLSWTPYAVCGLVLLVVATVVAVVDARWPLPRAVGIAVLVLDLAGLGLMRLVPEGNGVGILCVLVAMWLGADLQLRGVLVTMGTTLAVVSAPSLMYFGPGPASASRALLMTVVAAMCSLTVAGASQVWARQNRELEAQGRRLEEALVEVNANRALNEAIVTTVDVGLVAIDRDGRFTFTNPRHAEFLALAFPEGHHGQAGQEGAVYAADRMTRLAPADMPTSRAQAGESFADYVIWVGEDHATQRALSVSAGPVADSSGEFGGAVLVYTDITDLMYALKVKDDFVASVSHELRTPLTAIMGFLDLVLDEDDTVSADVRQNLDVVKRNSERLLRLVSDLLFTAQAVEGHVSVDLEDTDLSALVEQALADLAPRAGEVGVELGRRLPPGLVVQGDAVRIRQMVDNLVSNAIKYTPAQGSVTVQLQEDGADVLLRVSDTGIGISPADQSRLFSRFFRTRDAETRAIQGIGLGLAITRSIVEAHGGTIRVESQVGAGTTFLVRLPRHGPARAHAGSLSLIVDEAPGRIASRRAVSATSAVS
jgi:signal transduction histidine kinase